MICVLVCDPHKLSWLLEEWPQSRMYEIQHAYPFWCNRSFSDLFTAVLFQLIRTERRIEWKGGLFGLLMLSGYETMNVRMGGEGFMVRFRDNFFSMDKRQSTHYLLELNWMNWSGRLSACAFFYAALILWTFTYKTLGVIFMRNFDTYNVAVAIHNHQSSSSSWFIIDSKASLYTTPKGFIPYLHLHVSIAENS